MTGRDRTYGAIKYDCPNCLMPGKLFGALHIDVDPNPDYVAPAEGEDEPFPGRNHHLIAFMARAFSCEACGLELRNHSELEAQGVDVDPFGVHETEILGNFDPVKYLQ